MPGEGDTVSLPGHRPPCGREGIGQGVHRSIRRDGRVGLKRPKRLEAAAGMKELMLRHFQAGWLAREEGRKVAFVTSGAPAEVLAPREVVPVYPDNHGDGCGVARAGGRPAQAAEA